MAEKLIMRNEITKSGAPLPLAPLLATKCAGGGIDDQNIKHIWENAITAIKQLVVDHVPGVEPMMPTLWQLDAQKAAITQSSDAFCVSLDSYDTTGAYALGVSRHFKVGGNTQIAVGERPGYATLSKQLEELKKLVGDRPVMLFEDDMFTGGTAKFVLGEMKKVGLKVTAFVPGLQASDIQSICGVPVRPIERYSQGVRDIVDPRDLLFGLPDAGLVISDHRKLYRAPYCLPYVDIAARASIPAHEAVRFSEGVVDLNLTFFRQLQALLGETIYVHDLAMPFIAFVDGEHPQGSEYLSIEEFCAYTKRQLMRKS